MNLLACLTPAAWRDRPSDVPWLRSRVHPEHRQAHMQAGDSGHKPCLLELVPDSWWLQFIHMLTDKDKLALFQVSLQLAIRLMQNADQVDFRLQLYPQIDRGQQVKQGQADTRCSATIQLMRMLTSLKISMQTRKQRPMPFPIALSSHITSIDRFHDARRSPSTAVLDWAAFHNLSQLHYISRCISKKDISRLCKVLEARCLPKLQRVSFEFTSEAMATGMLPDSITERLARALGPQLRKLATNAASLLTYLPHCKALQAVSIHSCEMTAAQVQRLCEQPSLQTVHLWFNVKVIGDHSKRSCSWGSLDVNQSTWRSLPALPLASVSQICIVGGMRCSCYTERQMLQALIAEHGGKFKCQPNHILPIKTLPTFSLEPPCEEMLPLLAKLDVPCRLQLTKDASDASLMHAQQAVGNALPACVQIVSLDWMSTVDWPHL